MNGLGHLSYEESLSELGLFSLEKRQGGLINVYKFLKERYKQGARFFTGVSSDRTRGNRQRLKHKRFHLNVKETLFHCEDDRVQVAQQGCGVYTLGDIQKLSGYGPGQPAFGDPTQAGELDQVISRGPF